MGLRLSEDPTDNKPDDVLLLLLVIGLTQSRIGWLQIGLLIVRAIAMRARAGLRLNRPQLAMLGVLFAAGVLRGFAVTMLWSGVTHL